MAVKIIKFDRGITHIYLAAIAIVCVALTWYFIKWNFANVIAAGLDIEQPELIPVADLLTKAAPDDPATHLAAARLYERTFDISDLSRSLTEYETAASLAPSNYNLWLELAKAYDRSGESSKAEEAFRHALELAPNYSVVQWAYGNSLIRHGRSDEGFALAAKAAASDPEYAGPIVSTALQIFDGDVAATRRALGETPETNAALAGVLAAEGSYDDAASAWSQLAADDKRAKFKTVGDKLVEQFVGAKKYRLASQVSADLVPEGGEKPVVEKVSNGGFETTIKMRGAGIFEWQIGEGPAPQIGLSEGEKHGGKYSLLMAFNTSDPAAFRAVSQTVAVVPGATYELEIFYRSDLKTAMGFKWEVADLTPASPALLASTPAITAASDWTSLKAKFTVPATSDGVMIRLTREGCAGGSCPANGKISFDDISIKRL